MLDGVASEDAQTRIAESRRASGRVVHVRCSVAHLTATGDYMQQHLMAELPLMGRIFRNRRKPKKGRVARQALFCFPLLWAIWT